MGYGYTSLIFYLEIDKLSHISDIINTLNKIGSTEIHNLQFYKYNDRYSGVIVIDSDLALQHQMTDNLLKTKGVKKVEFLGKIIKEKAFPLTSLAVKDIIRGLDIAGKVFAFHLGSIIGSELTEVLTYRSSEELLNKAFLFIKGNGLGIPSLIEHIPEVRCIVKVERLFECLGVTSREPNSHFFRGFLSGILSKLWETSVRVIEIRCIALGDKHCEFIATPGPTSSLGF